MSNELPLVKYKDKTIFLTGGSVVFSCEPKQTKIVHSNQYISLSNEFNCLFNDESYDSIVINHDVETEEIKIENRDFSCTNILFDGIKINPGTSKVFELKTLRKAIVKFEHINSDQSLKLYIYGNRREDDISDSEKREQVISSNIPGKVSDQSSKIDHDHTEIAYLLEHSDKAEHLGKGVSRTVYRIEDKEFFDFISDSDGSIVKVGRTWTGVESNRKEMQTWQAVKGLEARKFFCPITSIGPSHEYIIMKEAEDIQQVSVENQDKLQESIKDHLDFQGSKKSLFEDVEEMEEMWNFGWDIHSSNVGYYNNRPVLIDYPYGGSFRPTKQLSRNVIKRFLELVL